MGRERRKNEQTETNPLSCTSALIKEEDTIQWTCSFVWIYISNSTVSNDISLTLFDTTSFIFLKRKKCLEISNDYNYNVLAQQDMGILKLQKKFYLFFYGKRPLLRSRQRRSTGRRKGGARYGQWERRLEGGFKCVGNVQPYGAGARLFSFFWKEEQMQQNANRHRPSLSKIFLFNSKTVDVMN